MDTSAWENEHILGDDLPLPPARLFERLAHIPNYTWDQSVRVSPQLDSLTLTTTPSLRRSIPHMTTGTFASDKTP
jgi:hypothetical protein